MLTNPNKKLYLNCEKDDGFFMYNLAQSRVKTTNRCFSHARNVPFYLDGRMNWKNINIKECKLYYKISSSGNVFSLIRNKLLKPSFVREYARVRLVPNYKSFLVHRLVLITFDRKPKKGEECIHKDNNPFNNHIDNLKWGSHKENMFYDRGNNHSFIGMANPNRKVTEKIVKEIRKYYKKRQSFFWGKRKLSQKYNISEQQINNIAKQKKGGWQNVK